MLFSLELCSVWLLLFFLFCQKIGKKVLGVDLEEGGKGFLYGLFDVRVKGRALLEPFVLVDRCKLGQRRGDSAEVARIELV